MKRLSWKYMAGLIDGEGCLDMQVFDYVRPRLRITLAGDGGKALIETMKNNFGGNIENKPSKNPNWSDATCWCLTGSPLRAFLQNTFKHMILKSEQAKFCIWWMDHCKGKHVSEKVRQCAHEELKAMKRHSQRLNEEAVAVVQQLMR